MSQGPHGGDPEQEAPSPPPGRPPTARRAFAWEQEAEPRESAWSVALFHGEMAFLAVALVGEALAFGQKLIGELPLSLVTTARLGGLYFFAFHHVPIAFEATRSRVAGPFLEVSVALLTVTALAVFLLFRGGRAAGTRAGGGPVRRAARGALVAVPYAGLSLFMSYVVSVQVPLPLAFEGGELRITVSHLWAAVWPALIAGGAGVAGGVWSGREAMVARPWGRRVVAAMGGAWRMFLYGLGLSLLGLVVMAAVRPSAARAYVDGTLGGGARGLDELVHHALVLPNQSIWVLSPAMGSCDGVYGSADTVDLLCYRRVPRNVFLGRLLSCPAGRPWDCVRFESAPSELFAFLLVPLAATVLAGVGVGPRAASRGEAAAIGALAGIGFAALVAAGAVLGGVALTVRSQGSAPVTTMVGPPLWLTAAVALAWAVVGGAAGALLASGRRARSVPEMAEASF